MTKNYLKVSSFVAMILSGMLFVATPVESYANNANSSEYQNEFDIAGKVVDTDGLPVIGATAVIKGTTNGSVTDLDGAFHIQNAQATDTIVVSYVGYTTLNAQAAPTMNLVISEAALAADEVVVVGFGTQKKVNVTGAVGMVTSEAIEARPVVNVSQALQGVVPGLNFSTNSAGGELNGAMNFNIRGTGTINANNANGSNSSPLVLIDGVEGDMNSINPNDILNISVLKDASSSSIYGSRAAYGVILVTTKAGKSGKTKISYSTNVRFSDVTNSPDVADSYTYALFKNRAAANQGIKAIYSDEMLQRIQDYQAGIITDGAIKSPDGKTWQGSAGTNGNTNWYDVHYKDWVPSHEHNLSINGGNDNVTYLLSGSYLNQNGFLRYGDDKLNRYTINARINAKVTSWLDANYTAKWVRSDYDQPTYMTYSSGVFYHGLNNTPVTVPLYNPDGHYSQQSNVDRLMEGGRTINQKNYVTNQLQLIAKPLKDWRIIAEGSMKTTTGFDHEEILPVYTYDVAGVPQPFPFVGGVTAAGLSLVNETVGKTDFYTTNIYSDYTKTLNGHTFKVMGGFNAELSKYRNLFGQRKDLITSSLPTLNTATSNDLTKGGYTHWATAGFFGRVNYDYKGRYLLEANLRYDGTSRFIGDERWAVFPSFSAGWNVAREAFFESATDLISTLKIRGSWGQLGNTNTKKLYPFYETVPLKTGTGQWLIDGQLTNTASATALVSSSLTWETIESWNVGLDFAMLNNRLTGSFDYFERVTKGAIGPAPQLPGILGAAVPQINNSDLKSYGFELELAWRDKIGDFSYGIKAVLSDAQQVVLSYPNENRIINNANYWRSGQKLGEIWGFETVGIAKTQEEMDAHLAVAKPNFGVKWGAGDIMYADKNGDGVVSTGKGTEDDPGDMSIIGNTTPRYNYGITVDLGYKWFDASIFVQGVGKRDFAPSGPFFWGAQENNMQTFCYYDHWDFFRPEGDPLGANLDSYYPRPLFQAGGKNQKNQTKYIQNASYIRLKNVQLGYSLSKKNLDKIGMSSLRVYISADNLWTGSSIANMYDPEALSGRRGDGKVYPLSRTISLGVNVNF